MATAIYIPTMAVGNPHPYIKGRPLLTVENCPALGSIGDLILADPSQVGVAVHVPKETSPADSPLMVGIMEGGAANRAIMAMGTERRRVRIGGLIQISMSSCGSVALPCVRSGLIPSCRRIQRRETPCRRSWF